MYIKGQGEVEWGPSTKNCFIVFLDIGGHGGLKTFYGIEKYCSNLKISPFQNRDYHRLTLRKLAISPRYLKMSFFGFKTYFLPQFSSKCLETSQGYSVGSYKKT